MRFKDDTFTCSGCGDTFGLDTHSYYYKVGRRVYCPECMAADYHDKYDEDYREAVTDRGRDKSSVTVLRSLNILLS